MAKKHEDDGVAAEEATVEVKPDKPVKGVAKEPPSPLRDLPVSSPRPPAVARVPLRVYMRCSGRRWDQIAGFVCHAQAHKLGPRTMLEWRAEFEKFMNSPA